MIATNFEFEYSETRTTHPRRANFNNLINIQLDTSKDNLNQGCVKIMALSTPSIAILPYLHQEKRTIAGISPNQAVASLSD